MDPDACLKEILEIAREAPEASSVDDLHACETLALRQSELVLALDEWIRNGGALPTQWRAKA
jgi:hypothetical protein